MQHRSGHMSAASRAPVTPLRAATGMLVALAVALGLYFTIGQNSKEVPAWITLPPGASVQASESAPEDQADGGVRYYLRFKMPGDVATALTQFTSGIRETKWEVAAPRVATRDDLGVRGSWPEWVKKQMHRVPDVSAGRAMSGSASGERLYAYAWPTKEACVVELVVMGTARGPAAPAKAKPVEE